MRNKERVEAQGMRKKGFSLSEISKKLGVSKSSVSGWVRNIVLSKAQTAILEKRYKGSVSIEKRRRSRLVNEEKKRSIVVQNAKSQVRDLISDKLFIAGTMLYFAEGGKRQRGLVRFSNSDPDMIKVMMKYFTVVCQVSDTDFRGHIHTHSQSQVKKAEKYWSGVSDIPLKQFYKTFVAKKKAGNYAPVRVLEYGTFDIYICNTQLFLTIQGWTQGLVEEFIS
jgi:predicted transcriptional regulator